MILKEHILLVLLALAIATISVSYELFRKASGESPGIVPGGLYLELDLREYVRVLFLGLVPAFISLMRTYGMTSHMIVYPINGWKYR